MEDLLGRLKCTKPAQEDQDAESQREEAEEREKNKIGFSELPLDKAKVNGLLKSQSIKM